MKCPIQPTPAYSDKGQLFVPYKDCCPEECAWWDEDKNDCSIKVIAKELTNIQLKLYHIASVMPFKATL